MTGKPLPVVSKSAEPNLVRMLDDWRTENGERFVFPFHPAAGQLTLTTRFYADPAIRAILKAAEPKNLAEVAPLIEKVAQRPKLTA